MGNRTAFGKLLANQATIRQAVAEARMEITKSRLLCYLAAVQADEYGFKAAKAYIAMTKVDAPRMCMKIIDEAIQVHGAHGVSQDSRLSGLYTHVRHVRLGDGPDIVHLNTIAKEELKRRLRSWELWSVERTATLKSMASSNTSCQTRKPACESVRVQFF